jgi:hypothetical protein
MCLDVRGIQCGAVPVDVTSGVGFRLQRLKDALPRAIAPPAYETVVAGLVGPVPGWDVAPAGAAVRSLQRMPLITLRRSLQGCPRVGSLGRCGTSARHCGSVRSLRAIRLYTPQAFRQTHPSAASERRSPHCVALPVRERYHRNGAVCRPTGSGGVGGIAALYACAMSSGLATKAGRSRRCGPDSKPDFSGDFHPASREIKQERRST